MQRQENKMMTRKDYKTTAEILFMFKHAMSAEAHKELIKEFSIMFENDNPNFSAEIFEEAVMR
jgi:hypothetical protein